MTPTSLAAAVASRTAKLLKMCF